MSVENQGGHKVRRLLIGLGIVAGVLAIPVTGIVQTIGINNENWKNSAEIDKDVASIYGSLRSPKLTATPASPEVLAAFKAFCITGVQGQADSAGCDDAVAGKPVEPADIKASVAVRKANIDTTLGLTAPLFATDVTTDEVRSMDNFAAQLSKIVDRPNEIRPEGTVHKVS